MLLALTCGACGLTEPRMSSRVDVSVPVSAQTKSGDDLRGWRVGYEEEAAKAWSIHAAVQLLESPDHNFVDDSGSAWDEVDEVAFGARYWRELGPVLLGVGGEVGAGNSGRGYWTGDDDYGLVTALGTVRWDVPVAEGALSFALDLHYRWTYDFDSQAVGSGTAAEDAFGGWVLFLGAGWSW